MHLQSNTLLQGGKYKIVRFIASGGFGCTYEAQHIMLGKRVAIKEFFIENFCNRDAQTSHVSVGVGNKKALVEKLRGKFIDEARSIAQMSHQNIVTVSDVFQENGTAYYVMDYIDGESLSQIVRKRGRLPEQEALHYIKDVASALKYVHSLNRLHLDIKPANIMVGRDGHVTLIDFGVSKQYDEINGENTSTLMGYSAGYAPVEQMGNRVKTFTPATDIYALGATFYSLLSGIIPPLDATDRADEDTLEPLPSVISTPIRNAIKKAMNVSRNGRVQSIDEFIRNIGASDTTVTSTPISSKTADERTLISDNTESSMKESISDNIHVEVHTEAETDPREIYYKALGFHDKKNYKEAFPLFMQSANLGYGDALYQVGEYYSLGLISAKNKIEAFKWYKKAAEEGFNRGAKQKLGWCYLCGVGVEQNETEAIEWYEEAAEEGMHEAAMILGYITKRDLDSLFLKAKSSYGDDKIGLWTYIAKLGHVGAQFELGECYSETFSAFKDEKKAFEWYTKAAEQGHPDAQYRLAECYYWGRGTTRNNNTATIWYIRAAKQGHPEAQNCLGQWYEIGLNVGQNLYKAFELYSKAAEQGNQDAAERAKALGEQLQNGPYVRVLQFYRSKQYDKAIKDLKELEKYAVLPEAQYLLGECYFHGRGVPKDEKKAFEWYAKAAEQGYKDAQYQLAICYEHGWGATKNENTATNWYKKAAEQGHPIAQLKIGNRYRLGEFGVSKNRKEAVEWFVKAAEQGSFGAMKELGWCYLCGVGVEQDESEAVKWFKTHGGQEERILLKQIKNRDLNNLYHKATCMSDDEYKIGLLIYIAKLGHAEAQYALAESYFLGQDVLYDESEAIEWCTKAAEQGNKAAKDRLEWISGNQSLKSAPVGFRSSHKDDLQNEAKEKKDTNHKIGFIKKIFS